MKLAFIVALLLATSPVAAQVPINQRQQPLGAGGQGTQSQLCVDDPTYCSTTGGTASVGSSSSGASSSSSGSASGGSGTAAPVPDSICGNGFPMGLAGCY
jgi:hypothetical protein